MRGMVVLSPNERSTWEGYDFQWGLNEVRRPDHSFEENRLHPPMMANTHCAEKGEVPNLALFTEEDVVIFKVTKPITGGDVLLVDYGKEYNEELLLERREARQKHEAEIKARANRQHNFKCGNCGHTCHDKFRLRHYKQCAGNIA